MASALTGGQPSAQNGQPLALTNTAPNIARAPSPTTSILLVDDDENSLVALGAILEPLGQRLVAARSGEEALRRLLRDDFAVIVLDVRMPGLDGLQTARYINARARTRRIPIIFLTGHAQDVEQALHAYAAGAVDYVEKPCDPDVLRSKVAVFVELQRERAERIREARARAEAETIASTASKLQTVSDAALAHLELDELLPEILERTGSIFEVDLSGLLLSDAGPDGATLIVRRGEELSSERLGEPPSEGPLGSVLRGSPLHISELSDEHLLPGIIAASGLRSLIAAPLSTGKQPLGALFLGSRDPHRFSDEDALLLGLSADRAAMAVAHARTYERERELVEVMQRHLLPDRLPEAPGLALAARYRPSERAAQVGGDWYDAIVLPEERVGLAIGDVVGHGIRAAALMSELRAALRAYAVAEPASPGGVLSHLNALVARTHVGMVATVLYLVVDADGTRVRFASAGHLPPLLITADGGARFLEHLSAPPLGAAKHTTFETWEGELEPGGTLLLYTDGLVERRGEMIDTGLQRLREAVGSGPEDLDRLCSHTLERASGGAKGQDDIALLAVRRLDETWERLEIDLLAEPESVPASRHRLERWLLEVGAGPDDLFAIKLAVNEACTNAVQHAYGPEHGRSFHLFAERSSDAVAIQISDDGRWRAPRGSRRGVGLGVIEQLMDEVDVEQSPTGTTVRMRKVLAGDAG